jgi:hypothetical protein
MLASVSWTGSGDADLFESTNIRARRCIAVVSARELRWGGRNSRRTGRSRCERDPASDGLVFFGRMGGRVFKVSYAAN